MKKQRHFKIWCERLNTFWPDPFFISHDGLQWSDQNSIVYDFGEDYILIEWIGESDLKGNKIFDQDIVRIKYPNGVDFENTIGRVFWDESESQYFHGNTAGRPPKRMWKYATIIGNVFENPKLVKKLYK